MFQHLLKRSWSAILLFGLYFVCSCATPDNKTETVPPEYVDPQAHATLEQLSPRVEFTYSQGTAGNFGTGIITGIARNGVAAETGKKLFLTYILTAQHVIDENPTVPEHLTVNEAVYKGTELLDHDRYLATVVCRPKDKDLILISVKTEDKPLADAGVPFFLGTVPKGSLILACGSHLSNQGLLIAGTYDRSGQSDKGACVRTSVKTLHGFSGGGLFFYNPQNHRFETIGVIMGNEYEHSPYSIGLTSKEVLEFAKKYKLEYAFSFCSH